MKRSSFELPFGLSRPMVLKGCFVLLVFFSFLPFVRSEIALALGIAWGLWVGPCFDPAFIKRLQTYWLQAAVVGLGFSIPILVVLKVGVESIPLTVVTILATLISGRFLSIWIKLPSRLVTLVSVGTAICGGSAIAAVAPVISAKSEETSMSLAVVFTLNAIALFVFPFLGQSLGLNEIQFGQWAALAIHDTSSVVGAATSFGPKALEIATTVKLVRALWILPIALMFGFYFSFSKKHLKTHDDQKKITVPWFIFLFIAASFCASGFPALTSVWVGLAMASKRLMVATLFLIGAGINRKAIQESGRSVLTLGFTLWVLVAAGSLIYVKSH